ncbi:MAG: hypothetical protein ABFC78_07890 [Methanoregula sp.]
MIDYDGTTGARRLIGARPVEHGRVQGNTKKFALQNLYFPVMIVPFAPALTRRILQILLMLWDKYPSSSQRGRGGRRCLGIIGTGKMQRSEQGVNAAAGRPSGRRPFITNGGMGASAPIVLLMISSEQKIKDEGFTHSNPLRMKTRMNSTEIFFTRICPAAQKYFS